MEIRHSTLVSLFSPHRRTRVTVHMWGEARYNGAKGADWLMSSDPVYDFEDIVIACNGDNRIIMNRYPGVLRARLYFRLVVYLMIFACRLSPQTHANRVLNLSQMPASVYRNQSCSDERKYNWVTHWSVVVSTLTSLNTQVFCTVSSIEFYSKNGSYI